MKRLWLLKQTFLWKPWFEIVLNKYKLDKFSKEKKKKGALITHNIVGMFILDES